jgi:chain length determinant protein EpsF
MTITQFLLVLRARWRLAVRVFLGVVFATILVSLLMPKLYTSTASVVVDTKADPVAVAVYAAQSAVAYVATQVDIISSERVAQRVAKNLKLGDSPENVADWKNSTGGKGDINVWLGSILQTAVTVTPSRDSSVIDIAVTWKDPKTAAILANAFAQAYIDTNIELKVDPAKQYAKWFDERSQELRADLEAKQKKLGDFQAASGIVATDGRLDIENARLAELSNQLLTIEAQRQDSQSRQRQATGDYASMPEVLQSPYIASLKADLARAEAKLQDLGNNVGKNHPDYQATAGEVASLQKRIEVESAKIAASLGNTTQVNLRRENDIRAALEAQKKRMLELTHQRDEASVLQDDVVTAQHNLDAVTQRLAQSSLESQTQQANISLLTTAVEPQKRSSPRYSLNLLVGLFLGGILGVAAAIIRELSDRRIREPSDLVHLLGIPLFARIPDIEPDQPVQRSSPLIATKVESPVTRVEPSAI